VSKTSAANSMHNHIEWAMRMEEVANGNVPGECLRSERQLRLAYPGRDGIKKGEKLRNELKQPTSTRPTGRPLRRPL